MDDDSCNTIKRESSPYPSPFPSPSLSSEELRHRFIKAETTLFKLRLESDDASEREAFLKSQNFQWELVTGEEKDIYKSELMSSSRIKRDEWEAEGFMKVSPLRTFDE